MGNIYLVLRIWRLSCLFLIIHSKRLSQFIFLPIVTLSFLGVAANLSPRLLLVSMILHVVLYVMFAVAWHQFILTPAENRTAWQYLKWNKDKWRYLTIFLMMVVLAVIIMNITVRPTLWLIHSLNGLALFFTHKPLVLEMPAWQWGFADLMALAALLMFSVPMSRLMMLLPSAALGESFNLRRIWALSGGSMGFCFVLFLSLCLSQIIFGYSGIILRYIIADLLGSGTFNASVGTGIGEAAGEGVGEGLATGLTSGGRLSVRLIDELIWQSFNYLTIAILITPLSLAYGLLTKK